MFTSASTAPNPSSAPAAAPHQAVTQLYRAAIGSVNTPYYLQQFAMRDGATPRTLSWNWAACLYTVNWMVFRGLWEAVFVYLASCLAAPLLIIGIGRLVFSLPDWLEVVLLVACAALAFAIPGVLGNALFFGKCRDKISAALSASDSLTQACLVLSERSPTRKRLVWTIAFNAGMLSLGISAAALLFGTAQPVAKKISPTCGPHRAALSHIDHCQRRNASNTCIERTCCTSGSCRAALVCEPAAHA